VRRYAEEHDPAAFPGQSGSGCEGIEELFTQSAASIVEMHSVVESLITDSDVVSSFQVKQPRNYL